MSAKASFWAWEQSLPPTQKLVLLALAHRHNSDKGRCDPSIAKVADDCGLSKASVKSAIKALCDAGLISSIPRSIDGLSISNLYRIHFSAGKKITFQDDPAQSETDNLMLSVSGGVGQELAHRVRSWPGVGQELAGGGSGAGYKSEREPKREHKEDAFGSDEPLCDDLLSKAKKTEAENDQFPEFWDAFPDCPRKTDQSEARALFRQIIEGRHKTIARTDPAVIIAGIKAYAASGPEPMWVPMPKTWLKGERWTQCQGDTEVSAERARLRAITENARAASRQH